MKILKWLLYIVLVLAALVLIVPLFLPSTVQVSAEKEVAVSPEQAFHNLASYSDRNAWDPWLVDEPDAEFTIRSEPGYAGSEYTWNGKKIKTGRIRSYPEILVLQAVHKGPYEDLADSYHILMDYIDSNRTDVTMEAFEFYLTDPDTKPMVTQRQTLIAMPLQ
jgi:ABC-type glycerol-3-phosphate transport system permease component